MLFFNPGFLWMSALLREERENCCDDIAIGRTCDRVQFVRALINFKEYDLRMTRLANAFPAGRGQLLKRVTRIVHSTNKTLDPAEKIFLVVSCILVSLLVVATTGISPEGSSLPERHFLSPVKISGKVQISQQQQMEMDAQLIKNKEQTDRDVQQAIREKLQAERDASQAIRDKQQAERDAAQAILDKLQAEKDAANSKLKK